MLRAGVGSIEHGLLLQGIHARQAADLALIQFDCLRAGFFA